MDNGERIFKFLQRCQRDYYKPDLHTFFINVKNGRAYVECRGHNEVYIETRLYQEGVDKIVKWCGTTVAAANRLEKQGADYFTIDM